MLGNIQVIMRRMKTEIFQTFLGIYKYWNGNVNTIIKKLYIGINTG
jgi:hypothetical protein